MLGLFAAMDDRSKQVAIGPPDEPREPRPASLADSTVLASGRNHSLCPGVAHQHDCFHGLPRPPQGQKGSLQFPEAIRSRSDARQPHYPMNDLRKMTPPPLPPTPDQ
jgi:hypothetical protein